ncbi:MAG TPA: CRISPR-associated endonuclease Cas2 [Lentisphaeria bacterium]|nr:CRISPR-associated endonuclease Cas2 [Lentisphaeria bacterium]HCG50136.1 CRISPR-associated endonuclease Cas2 [Lentisphaeria bacterium]
MRLMVFFDLPTATSENRRNYRRFRKDLISNGFFMLQESVYCRMVINEAMAKSVVARIESFKPPQGMVCAMIITEKQFAGISFIVGDMKSDVVTTEQSLVIL